MYAEYVVYTTLDLLLKKNVLAVNPAALELMRLRLVPEPWNSKSNLYKTVVTLC